MGVGGRRTSAQQGELGGASGLGRQQAWSPEPSRTPVLRSSHVGQVTFDTQQGCPGDHLVLQVQVGLPRSALGGAQRGCS